MVHSYSGGSRGGGSWNMIPSMPTHSNPSTPSSQDHMYLHGSTISSSSSNNSSANRSSSVFFFSNSSANRSSSVFFFSNSSSSGNNDNNSNINRSSITSRSPHIFISSMYPNSKTLTSTHLYTSVCVCVCMYTIKNAYWFEFMPNFVGFALYNAVGGGISGQDREWNQGSAV
ncbi:hypothetical protein C1H46_042901 [Malus baccata]|uniref:Uncharacterized protein n=1 Tax=Malus baccata TaxID=106549 RepID=A0A540KBG3_MALBA|nr:hypothetical protein C1H46_042901 [Malus baccata]